jgi:hypothetical protein
LGAAIAALRGSLPADDRAILILHLGRSLSLADLAVTSLGEGAPRREVVREVARLRERLQGIRAAMARAAAEHRLLDSR